MPTSGPWSRPSCAASTAWYSTIASQGPRVYQDAHGSAPILPEVLEMLAELAPRCPELRAITIEIEDADQAMAREQLRQTREAVSGLLAAREGAA